MCREQSVYFVRHGQRADEAPAHPWNRNHPQETWHDPPLTEEGKHHAGEHARTHLAAPHGAAPFTCIYSSPFRRCVETAAAIATVLNNTPIKIVLALGSCAAAAAEAGIARLVLDPVATFQAEYPHITFLAPDARVDLIDFMDVSARVIDDHVRDCGDAGPRGRAMIVAHREGIRFVAPHYRVPYCGTVLMRRAPRPAPAPAATRPCDSSTPGPTVTDVPACAMPGPHHTAPGAAQPARHHTAPLLSAVLRARAHTAPDPIEGWTYEGATF